MNWGIIGLGYMSKQFASSINELNSNYLLAISSNSFFRLLKFGLRHKIKLKYQFSNYEDILSCKDVNNIYISTTNNTHHDLIIRCIEAKKNVLCEKPFVMNYDQAKNIKDKLNKSGILFLEGIAYRSHPQINNVINLIKKNSIGKVLKIVSSFGLNKGRSKKNKRLFNKDLGGGSILDLGCYPVSISNLIANIGNAKENKIPEIRKVIGKIYSDIDINAEAELLYDNGITSKIKVSIEENLDNSTIIYGSDGKLVICEPWLPNKESVIELHKNGEIKKFKTECSLSVFASQIDIFNKNIEKNNLECGYPSMNIDNSVNYMQVISKWKDKIFKNENKN